MSLPLLNQAPPPPAVVAGGRRLDSGFLQGAELGGGFTALPAVLTVTSDMLYVAGFNAFMAVVDTSDGGSFLYTLSWYNPPRVTDPVFGVASTLVVGVTVHSWGMGALNYFGQPFALMQLSWTNRVTVPGSTLNSIRLYGLARP